MLFHFVRHTFTNTVHFVRHTFTNTVFAIGTKTFLTISGMDRNYKLEEFVWKVNKPIMQIELIWLCRIIKRNLVFKMISHKFHILQNISPITLVTLKTFQFNIFFLRRQYLSSCGGWAFCLISVKCWGAVVTLVGRLSPEHV